MHRAVILTATYLLLPVIATSAANLNRVEIEKQIVDKSFVWTNPADQRTGSILFKSGGRVELEIHNRAPTNQFTGVWWFDNKNRLCVTWQVKTPPPHKCFSISNQGSGKYLTEHGVYLRLGKNAVRDDSIRTSQPASAF